PIRSRSGSSRSRSTARRGRASRSRPTTPRWCSTLTSRASHSTRAGPTPRDGSPLGAASAHADPPDEIRSRNNGVSTLDRPPENAGHEEKATVLQRNQISRKRIAALAASALLFAACSSAGTGATATPGTAATQPPAATTPPSAGASQGAEAYEVELGDNDKLGKFLTGEDG